MAPDDLAERYGRGLLHALGIDADVQSTGDHPAVEWRRAGLSAVTGWPDGAGLVAPVPLTLAARGALAAFAAIAPDGRLPPHGAALLGERSRLLGLGRRGAVSPNGSCRLLETLDGRIALNLPRPDDWAMLPALLGDVATGWADVRRLVSRYSTAALLDAGTLLGFAIARDQPASRIEQPFEIYDTTPTQANRARPLVVDLSSLWAGPLAASLLGMAGAQVIKVESVQRPDATRAHGTMFDLLNEGKSCAAFDFADRADVARLKALIDAADIIVESSRPRALAQLDIVAEQVVAKGKTWLSISAYGRRDDDGQRVGFGDDAAVAGGLSHAMRSAWGGALFAGDAIADPLTGIVAGLAGWANWRSGKGGIISVALSRVIAHAAHTHDASPDEMQTWQEMAINDREPLYPLRRVIKRAGRIGADTRAIIDAL